jgi:recombination protein RecT
MSQPNALTVTEDDFTPNAVQKRRWEVAIANSEKRFHELDGSLDFNAEAVFAYQLLSKNDFSMAIADKNPMSLKLAMVNLAATGLTLNPAHGYAYLVPRDGAIKLDISYRGFIKIATDAGSILWAKAELVYEGDEFVYHGPAHEPEHRCDPFGKRTVIRGAYCIDKTADGSILCDTMTLAELEHVRNCSEAWKRPAAKGGPSGPWKDWGEEMMRKTVIKRARKTWPQSVGMARLAQAVEIANDTEGGYDLQTPRLIGRPNDGVWEALDGETQIALERIALAVNDYWEAGDVEGAQAYIERQKLNSDEYAGLFTRFSDTKLKTALRKEARRTA